MGIGKMRKLQTSVVMALTLMMIVAGNSSSVPNVHGSGRIFFVGSVSESSITNSSGTHTTSVTLNYASHSGDFIFVAVNILFGCTIFNVTDSGGSTYSKLGRFGTGDVNGFPGNGTGNYVEVWSTTGRGSNASTSFTVTYFQNSPGTPCTGFIPGVSIAEYSGARDVLGAVVGNGNTLGNSDPTLSFTLTERNNWLISAFIVVTGTASSISSVTGNLRAVNHAPTGWGAVSDNTASSTTLVTTTIHAPGGESSGFWGAIGVELRKLS